MSTDRDRIELTGVVESANRDVFLVRTSSEQLVKCSLSGRMRVNQIKIVSNDKVKIEVSPLDTTNGRIVSRL